MSSRTMTLFSHAANPSLHLPLQHCRVQAVNLGEAGLGHLALSAFINQEGCSSAGPTRRGQHWEELGQPWWVPHTLCLSSGSVSDPHQQGLAVR